jgi:hypothetical protein
LGGPSSDPEKDFNGRLLKSINETLSDLLGQSVLEALHKHLKELHDVTPDEVPHRLDTLFEIFEYTFGVAATKTIGRAIARNFYARIGLQFVGIENYGLQDYVEQAKRTITIKRSTPPIFR